MLGAYVTLEAGTGVVHTAPGHGADDFNTGQKYGLEILAPIGPAGHFLDTVELFARPARVRCERQRRGGAEEARPAAGTAPISRISIRTAGAAINPVIFLATSQWFIRMDGEPAVGR